MKLKLHQNSLFAVLMRSPWWLSGLLAAGIFGATRLFMPIELAVFAASPFVVIAAYVAWKQLRAPSAERIAATLERLTAMSREGFTAALEAGWRREGYEVSRPGGAFDLELRREGRVSLVVLPALEGGAHRDRAAARAACRREQARGAGAHLRGGGEYYSASAGLRGREQDAAGLRR
jgi:restriction system protein